MEVWGGGGVGGGDPRVIISLYTAPKIICISFPHNNRAYMTAGADAPYTSGCYRHIYLAQKPDIYRCLGCNRVTNSVFMLRFRFFTGQCTIMDIFCVDSRVCTYAHLQYMIHLRPYHVHCSFQLKYMHIRHHPPPPPHVSAVSVFSSFPGGGGETGALRISKNHLRKRLKSASCSQVRRY